MRLELLFENLTEGLVEDIENSGFVYSVYSDGVFIVKPSEVTLRTERTCQPASLNGTIPDVKGFVPLMGATVRLKVNDVTVFYGRVFSTNINRWGVLSFTAYDSIRYLKNSYSYFYKKAYSPTQVIRDIANHYQLKVGHLVELPTIGQELTIENECCFDLISDLVDTATVLTEKAIVFYDNCGEICLSYADEMIGDVIASTKEKMPELETLIIGDNSLAFDYEFSTNIDEDTFNEVFLYRNSESKGGRYAATPKDEYNVAKWGHLRMTEQADENMTNEQMNDKAYKLLEMKNRPMKSMNVSAMGVVGLRAGMMVNIDFPSLANSVSKRQKVIIDSIEHKFEDENHTMDLSVHTFWRDIEHG